MKQAIVLVVWMIGMAIVASSAGFTTVIGVAIMIFAHALEKHT